MVLVLAFNLKGLLPWAIPVSGPAFTTPRGMVMLIGVICFAVFLDAAPSHPEFVGWGHIALNVGNKPEMDRMVELARLTSTLLSPPHMTGDGFYETVITDPDPNQVELVGCDLLISAYRSLYRVVKVSRD